METSTIIREIVSETEMRDLGGYLAEILRPGHIVALRGPLGAGKTTLVRAILWAKGIKGPVRSPTYTLVESYMICGVNLHHFDFYRFSEPAELEEAGFRECFSDSSICLVEWPENATGFLPQADLTIRIEYMEKGRRIYLTSNTVNLDLLRHI
ncbi:MAG: tRNA (adenosine(37)-N6)-threonylcarbamoyltransferase complex ATPase subunit type 1 TsaE [Proteobacteria bacterium]|nr:tRNA (adenosine(37)-N6)-threonylcarbamoyltransferase complex ATPase subunit type 1 TsaE [Pseudomonadota bacterium]MDE3207937.1 tRNA (adenosine(37)-N6)-threonylcarbamoyltransferase complex ATPase subunit type 1 TsaE [Pseudomonadota bacterium]